MYDVRKCHTKWNFTVRRLTHKEAEYKGGSHFTFCGCREAEKVEG